MPRHKKEQPHIPMECAVCGRKFLATRRDRQYCSEACKDKRRLQRRPRVPLANQTIWRKRRYEIWEAQGRKCWLCGKPIEKDEGFNVHHLSGDHDTYAEDVVALHRSCHTQLHSISLLIKDGKIVFDSPIVELVKTKLQEHKEKI